MKPFTAVLVACLAGLGFAQAEADDDYDACMAESGGVTVAMLDCLGAASDRVQSAMDTLLPEHRRRGRPSRPARWTPHTGTGRPIGSQPVARQRHCGATAASQP